MKINLLSFLQILTDQKTYSPFQTFETMKPQLRTQSSQFRPQKYTLLSKFHEYYKIPTQLFQFWSVYFYKIKIRWPLVDKKQISQYCLQPQNAYSQNVQRLTVAVVMKVRPELVLSAFVFVGYSFWIASRSVLWRLSTWLYLPYIIDSFVSEWYKPNACPIWRKKNMFFFCYCIRFHNLKNTIAYLMNGNIQKTWTTEKDPIKCWMIGGQNPIFIRIKMNIAKNTRPRTICMSQFVSCTVESILTIVIST